MKKLLGVLGVTGEKGIIGLISEKTGKISFKRSAAIMILTGIVLPDYLSNGLTKLNVILAIGVLLSVSLEKIINITKIDN